MNFNFHQIHYLSQFYDGPVARLEPGFGPVKPHSIRVASNMPAWNRLFETQAPVLQFTPPRFWQDLSVKPG